MSESTPDLRRVGVLTLAITAAFGLFFALAVWSAVGNAIHLSGAWAVLDQTAPWWLFAIGMVVPIGLYVLAFVLGRYRSLLDLAVLLLTALAVTSALSLGLEALLRLMLDDLMLGLR